MPSTVTARYTAMLAREIGTGLTGMAMEMGPSTQITAAITAVSVS